MGAGRGIAGGDAKKGFEDRRFAAAGGAPRARKPAPKKPGARAGELTISEERERRRLARGLHDRVGQPLALAILRLGALEGQLAAEGAAVVREVRAALKGVVGTTRELSFEISNPLLHSAGLGPAIEHLAHRIGTEHGLRVKTRDVDFAVPQLPEALRVVAYQVVRELLLNSVKHADATSVAIGLRRNGVKCVLTVEDRGAGFDPRRLDSTVEAPGFGLLEMRERLDRLGGRLEIETAPGKGTRVAAHLPLS